MSVNIEYFYSSFYNDKNSVTAHSLLPDFSKDFQIYIKDLAKAFSKRELEKAAEIQNLNPDFTADLFEIINTLVCLQECVLTYTDELEMCFCYVIKYMSIDKVNVQNLDRMIAAYECQNANLWHIPSNLPVDTCDMLKSLRAML